MNVLGPDLEGAAVVDLFAGTGALGLEALSRGAGHATFVERDRRVLDSLRQNIAALDAGDLCTVVSANVFTYLDTLAPESFDLAVADPPYAKGLADRLVKRYMRIPFARILSVEHGAGERLELPATAEERRYGDTVIAFIVAADLKEEEQ
jgi:16S rRNA (guanine966-N2)-methyltransferase